MNGVDDFLKSKIADHIYSGAALIAGTGETRLEEAYHGTLSFGQTDHVTENTLFDLQSITKSVAISPLVHVLVSSGKLQLSETISGTLKDYPNKDITVRHLLHHTSGLNDEDLDFKIKNISQAWHRISETKPRSACGERIQYADLGYRILGRFIELKCDQNLELLCHRHVWSPLGLRSMSYVPFDTANTAGVSRSQGRIDDEGVFKMGTVLGDDGVFSTARDLESFLRAILDERGLLKGYKSFLKDTATTQDKITDFYTVLRNGSKNLGWEINQANCSYAGPWFGESCIEKSGGAGTFIWLDLASGCYMVYLTNHGKPEPFTQNSWNKLMRDVAPDKLPGLIWRVR